MISAEPLAKSSGQTLLEHTREVSEAAMEMARILGEPLSQVEGAQPEGAPSLAQTLRIAAFFHDLGKAASGFQAVLSWSGDPRKRPKWGYRHEALSTAMLLACLPPDANEKWKLRLVAAVLTHHKNLDHESLTGATGAGLDEEDFQAGGVARNWRKKIVELESHWDWLRATVESARSDGTMPPEFGPLPDSPSKLPDLHAATQVLEAALPKASGLAPEALSWILTRGFLMGGDHLASAGHGKPRSVLLGKVRKAEGFQARMAQVRGSALLESPTGSGKTEAALHWALANRRGGERIFYVLPYQASINAMSSRLRDLFGEPNVGMLHGRAALQEFARHFDEQNDNYQQAAHNAKAQLDQTRQFYRPVKIVTPYQLLKLLFGARFWEIGVAELVGGLVIFDEIHAYDPHTMALLDVMLRQLQPLGVRFLFMSATFPPFLKDRLRDALGSLPLVELDRTHKRDAHLLQTARHTLKLEPCTLEALSGRIIEEAQHRKVLVVCNRVRQAQEMFQALSGHGLDVALLHSRFIARDRRQRENNLIAHPESEDAVARQIPRADILVSTQVVEVSLNLSFGTIYTEAAPVDALLQRFGRVNRSNQHGAPVPIYVATKYDVPAVEPIYPSERIQATLDNAPDGQDLVPAVEAEWVRSTYANGFTEAESSKYLEAHAAFEQTVGRLKPFYKGDDREYFELFDNYNVVPARFRKAFRQSFDAGRFFEASEYVASLGRTTFMAMSQHARLSELHHVYFLDRRYDNELGLLNEEETDPLARQEAFEEVCL